ncbi:MAG: MBOAT family O-acyltransferase, partial [Bacteroidota bacterium]|nr:MBOAT family O-acyltransferase [Bacteroidota bacterium]
GILINISQLVLLRYATFAIDPLFQLFSEDIVVSRISEILVPIGISYFTLQGLGYLINIKMGWEKPEKQFMPFLLYLTFFPKFLSGPIERSNHFLPQLKEKGVYNDQDVIVGIRIALFGFFKKVAIANQLAPFITDSFSGLDSATGFSLGLTTFLLPIYLYFDFSGYTDIAIGFARMFGINLLPNFNRPFFSENMTNFWKRFHISLSAWFGDYIFRQTVFKRRKWGVYASMYAVFITWVLFGIWHGAGWNFMLLGLLQALAINYEFFTRKWRYRVFSRFPGGMSKWIGRICTYAFYSISLVFFFSPDLLSTKTYFSILLSGNEAVTGNVLTITGIFNEIPMSAIVLILLFFLIEFIEEDLNGTYEKLNKLWSGSSRKQIFLRWTVYSAMLTMLFVLGSKVQQFIYAQF